MSTLQEQLDRLIQQNGEKDPLVQMLRNQITAEKSGKNFYELYTSRGEETEPPKAKTSGVTTLPIVRSGPQGFHVAGELLSAFEDVLRSLTGKRKTKSFGQSVAELADVVDESDLAGVGNIVDIGLPIHYLQMHICVQGMIDMLGLKEAQLETVTDAERAKFARDRLRALQSDNDADRCPGFWIVPFTDGKSKIFMGFSVKGYSFSGVECSYEGVFLSKADFVKQVCCGSEMLIDDQLCLNGTPTKVDQISDVVLLEMIWGD